MGKGEAADQTRQSLENIGHVLVGAGGNFGNVVQFTTYVVGRDGYLQGRSEVYPDIYPHDDFPPNTLLVVADLVDKDFLVEIKPVAILP